MNVLIAALSVAMIWGMTVHLHAAEMRLAVTTSFHNSGLAELLLPEIKKDIDLDVRMIVVGTGQALKLGRAGDVDAILVHSRAAEDAFVAQGFGQHRREIMYNDFVLIGPSSDPAKTRNVSSIGEAFTAIKQASSIFVSRGDDSGTHRKEQALWSSAEVTPDELDTGWVPLGRIGHGGNAKYGKWDGGLCDVRSCQLVEIQQQRRSDASLCRRSGSLQSICLSAA